MFFISFGKLVRYTFLTKYFYSTIINFHIFWGGFFNFNNEVLMDFEEIKKKILKFRNDRDWKQFHDPKNLAEAISIEASELLEIFLWSKVGESKKIAQDKKENISNELADIINFAILFAHETGIDIEEAILKKLEENNEKYPVDKAKGSSKKYTDLK